MDRRTLEQLFAYSDWANDRILEALQQLPEESLTRTLPSSFPTLRGTFAHIIGAERIWMRRWRGDAPSAPPDWVANGTLAVVGEEMRLVRHDRQEQFARVGDEEFVREATYHNLKGTVSWTLPVGQMLLHVVNHSTYHRGQITSMLRQLDVTPPATDFIIFAAG